jgi:hypothetical protein
MIEIDRPILICGPGKSGTTLLMDVLGVHPDVAWFSGWTDRFPMLPQLAMVSRLNDIGWLERRTRSLQRWPRPDEAYGIWDHFLPGFSRAERNWDVADLDADAAERLRGCIRSHLRWHGKPRFMTKYTGWARFELMRALLPGVELVQIDRDPRAVAYSYERYRWWFKDRPEALAEMSPRERIDFYAAKYLAYFETRGNTEGVHAVAYEALVANPAATLRELCGRIGLTFPRRFEDAVATFEFRGNTNEAWRRDLSPADQDYLTARLEVPIRALGYELGR